MDTQPMQPNTEPTPALAETRRPWWRCGASNTNDLTWLWVIIFITSGSTTVSSGGANPVAWLLLGASALLGLLLWWGASRKHR